MDAGIAGELRWWLGQAQDWSCYRSRPCHCDRCLIVRHLADAAAWLDQRSWAAAHRSVWRAAGIDSRLEPLAERLRVLAAVLSKEGPMADESYRWQPCGLTRAEHIEACQDAILRGAEYVIDEHHDDETRTHFETATHLVCVGTFVLRTLPGHVEDEWWCDVCHGDHGPADVTVACAHLAPVWADDGTVTA